VRTTIKAGIESEAAAHARANAAVGRTSDEVYITEEYIGELEAEMLDAAASLEFERAAVLRDRIEKMSSSVGKKLGEVDSPAVGKNGRGRRTGGARVPRPKRSH
jgi:excinuclease ABC subunit B